ncbi:hypothetical protein F5887DRAFT_892158 [Amanita rubescens]|nr:hypothetical protein F5887DRAFT_892158 [Amanita rubescens]
MLHSDEFIASTLVRQGMIPCAPFRPSYAVSICLLELYRNLFCRCPHLARQSFIKGLMDMQRLPYKPYYNTVFSITLDLYLDVLEKVQHRVLATLRRDQPLWRVKNTCPACSYQLHDEKDLKLKMLIAMDGNNSLKCLRRDGGAKDETDVRLSRCALPDSRLFQRTAPGDYYIMREEVDQWDKSVIKKKIARPESNSGENTSCSSRWNNMKDEVTSRMWGIFDETGIFLALCHHGFVLLVADMVKSGELAKYPLSITNLLLQVFGSDIGIGYDIGCQFFKTVKNSPLGELASELNFQSLVGSFHGHAHDRLCQISYLATYIEGLGIEDLEGCERFFSKSNALAASVRYASTFHRQQAIVQYMRHMDDYKTYANLSKFLVDNYKQALDISQSEALLLEMMKNRGITDPAIFQAWLDEEKSYLSGLKSEPSEESLEINYYESLVLFDFNDGIPTNQNFRDELDKEDIFYNSSPSTINARDYTRSVETKRRHAIEQRDNCLKRVHELELKLGVAQRWVPGSAVWNAAAEKAVLREYRKAVDNLEGLIVSRLFELSNLNKSQICYKLQRHIAKALQARSKAIKAALEKYNVAAAARRPPAPELSWDDVVEYAFLADFDLLRDTREDVRSKPWALQINRVLRDQYFKIQRAREEIDRLNIKICRLITHIVDETVFLMTKEESLVGDDPRLAHQISVYRLERGRANATHMQRFAKLAKLPGFTGQIKPGRSIRLPATMNLCQERVDVADTNEEEELEENDVDEEEEEEDDVEDEEEAFDLAFELLKISSDEYANEL